MWSNVIFYVIFHGLCMFWYWKISVWVSEDLSNFSNCKAPVTDTSWNFQLYSVIFYFKLKSKPFLRVFMNYKNYKKIENKNVLYRKKNKKNKLKKRKKIKKIEVLWTTTYLLTLKKFSHMCPCITNLDLFCTLFKLCNFIIF